MPATSRAQQKFFALVHGYQTGKIPADKVSRRIKQVAKTISPEDAKKYASTKHAGLKQEIHDILRSPAFVEETLREIVDTHTPAHIKGHLVDVYTASMLVTVLDKLNEHNRTALLGHPLNEMVAVAYKVLTK